MDWETVGLTALVTTIGTILVTFVGHRLTTRKDSQDERDRHATYLAVRVSAILDPFVMAAVSVSGDKGQYDANGELGPEATEPVLTLPDDVDWKSIDPHLMDRILTLPNEIASARSTIDFMGEVTGPPDYDEWFSERRYQWAKLGLMALDLATDLRRRYRLKPRDYSRYDPRKYFEREFRAESERRREAAEAAQRLLKAHERKKSKS